jgi:hypothetical protein
LPSPPPCCCVSGWLAGSCSSMSASWADAAISYCCSLLSSTPPAPLKFNSRQLTVHEIVFALNNLYCSVFYH